MTIFYLAVIAALVSGLIACGLVLRCFWLSMGKEEELHREARKALEDTEKRLKEAENVLDNPPWLMWPKKPEITESLRLALAGAGFFPLTIAVSGEVYRNPLKRDSLFSYGDSAISYGAVRASVKAMKTGSTYNELCEALASRSWGVRELVSNDPRQGLYELLVEREFSAFQKPEAAE